MKKLSYIFLASLVAIVFNSCQEKSFPYPEEETKSSQGAFLRVISVPSGIFDRNNIAGSEFNIILEAEDNKANKGMLTQSVDFTVQFIDNTPGNGNSSVAATAIGTIPISAFAVNNDSGLPRLDYDQTAQDMMDLLGLTLADLDGGDVFRFEWTQNLTDGRSYNRLNSSNSVQGETYYSSPYIRDVSVVCLLTDGYAMGDYTLEQTVGSADPFFGAPTKFEEGTVTLVEGGTPTRRVFDVNYISFDLDLEFDMVCGNVVVPSQPAGVGCGGGIIWVTSNDGPATHDPDDDSVIVINLQDDSTDDCGLQESMVLTLTKN